jgi:HK97 family phage major capsid protein
VNEKEKELRIALEAKSKELDAFDAGVVGKMLTDEQNTQRSKIVEEANGIIAEIKRASEAREIRSIVTGTAGVSVGGAGSTIKEEPGLRVFKNLGEQLRAIKGAAENPSNIDTRLIQLNNEARAALGMNEGVPSEGGFAVQTDFAGMLMQTAATAGNILPLVDKYEISGNSDRVRWVDIDETSIATTVFGGVMVYWAAEAATITASKPKLTERELALQKLMGVAYATYELEQDSNFISQLYTKAFTLAIQRELESCIVAGTGVGKPLGILKSGGLVTVAKEGGQAADTVEWNNIVKMYNRGFSADSNKYAWLMHDDVSEQLDFLSFPIGVGGVPVYLTASQQGSVSSLKGRPIISSDQCSALGDLGDINFVDLSQYFLITKGGVQAATSMHVQFLTAENCFRFIFRANGMPKKSSAVTIKNSAKTRSSFVTLAERA